MELPQGDDLSTFSKAGAGELRNVCKKSQKSEEKDAVRVCEEIAKEYNVSSVYVDTALWNFSQRWIIFRAQQCPYCR